MNYRAANQRKEDALHRVFMMLVALVLMTIQVRKDARRISDIFPGDAGLSQTAGDVQLAVMQLLCAAEIVAHRLISMMRADYELMKLAFVLALPGRERVCRIADQFGQPSKRLDSS